MDVWADDVVTLSLQYSTQWDSLAHVGAEFDADGDGIEEAVYYNGYRAGVDLVGPQPDAAGDGGNHRCFAHHLGLEHMAYHGRAGSGRPRRPGPPPRDTTGAGSTSTRSRRSWRPTSVVVEPGDMLLLHTGFATEVLEWDRHPDPVKIHTLCSYLDARDQSLLRVDRRLADLRAGGGQLRGRRPDRQGPRREPALVPPHPPPLPVPARACPLGEMWYLHELASWLREHDRSRFLLTAPPLRLPGVVGSPLTPVATV